MSANRRLLKMGTVAPGEGETGRREEGETRRGRDEETERLAPPFSQSPRLPVSQSACLLVSLTFLLALAGCDRLDMYDQPRYEPFEASDFFDDGLSARPRVEGTIPRGGLHEDEEFYTGKSAGKLTAKIPEAAYRAAYDRNQRQFDKPYDEVDVRELRHALLDRGRARFDIYCAVCHGRTGVGDGVIVRRGFRAPPSYQIDRLRAAPAGHFFDVITNGFGAMASYANRVDVDDRWAIVAYIRSLQLSQNARLEDVPENQRGLLGDEPVLNRITREGAP